MGLVIGIDVGGSTTKIIGLDNGVVQSPMYITLPTPSLRFLAHLANTFTTIAFRFQILSM